MHWKRWGPYVAERAWGTVREDYSANGDAWNYFPTITPDPRVSMERRRHGGLLRRHQIICFALALWNGQDPILKERLFGLTGPEGNHGEDVKGTTTTSTTRPRILHEVSLQISTTGVSGTTGSCENRSGARREDPEFELSIPATSTRTVLRVMVEYAKADPEDILIRITAINRGPDAAPLHILPTIWYRNSWRWSPTPRTPSEPLALGHPRARFTWTAATMAAGGCTRTVSPSGCSPRTRQCARVNDAPRQRGWFKDGINDYVVSGRRDAVNPDQRGTKASPHYALTVPAGASAVVKLRFSDKAPDVIDRASSDPGSTVFSASGSRRPTSSTHRSRTQI